MIIDLQIEYSVIGGAFVSGEGAKELTGDSRPLDLIIPWLGHEQSWDSSGTVFLSFSVQEETEKFCLSCRVVSALNDKIILGQDFGKLVRLSGFRTPGGLPVTMYIANLSVVPRKLTERYRTL